MTSTRRNAQAPDQIPSADVRPQDDLFGWVNREWLATAQISADLPAAGAFVDLVLDAERQVADILEAAAGRSAGTASGSNEQKIGDLYASFMATDRVEALGFRPVLDHLAAIEAVADTGELVHLLGTFERGGVPGLLVSHVDTDDRYVVNIGPGGLGLPDETYYRDDSFAPVRAAYGRRSTRRTASGSGDRLDLSGEQRFDLLGDHWVVGERP
ncbi:MAG: hypothetical protein H0T17_01075 [Propionibacteriales bacterium]|nr:hypothetical protein [Propionibacteriales bacterium]